MGSEIKPKGKMEECSRLHVKRAARPFFYGRDGGVLKNFGRQNGKNRCGHCGQSAEPRIHAGYGVRSLPKNTADKVRTKCGQMEEILYSEI